MLGSYYSYLYLKSIYFFFSRVYSKAKEKDEAEAEEAEEAGEDAEAEEAGEDEEEEEEEEAPGGRGVKPTRSVSRVGCHEPETLPAPTPGTSKALNCSIVLSCYLKVCKNW